MAPEAPLSKAIDKRGEWIDRQRGHVTELRQRAAQAAAKLSRLYATIADEPAQTEDQEMKDRIRELTVTRDELRAETDRAKAALEKLGPMPTAESRSASPRRRRNG